MKTVSKLIVAACAALALTAAGCTGLQTSSAEGYPVVFSGTGSFQVSGSQNTRTTNITITFQSAGNFSISKTGSSIGLVNGTYSGDPQKDGTITFVIGQNSKTGTISNGVLTLSYDNIQQNVGILSITSSLNCKLTRQ